MKRNALIVSALLLMMTSLYLVFIYAPVEAQMGVVQKIFFLMVPVAWLAMLAYVITAVASILFLRTKNEKWDIARASGEIGFVFTILTCTTGATWAKPVWGVWWGLGDTQIDVVAYIVVYLHRLFSCTQSRFGRIPGSCIRLRRGNRWSRRHSDYHSVYLIVGRMHPPELIFQPGGLDPKMGFALGMSIIAYTLLYFTLLSFRVAQRNDEAALRVLKDGD